jgi:hypothetical protein
LHIPEAGAPPPSPRRPSSPSAQSSGPTTTTQPGNGKEPGAKVTPLRLRRSTAPPPAEVATTDEQAGTASEDGARLGKMQRAAMRSKARPRPKGAKR